MCSDASVLHLIPAVYCPVPYMAGCRHVRSSSPNAHVPCLKCDPDFLYIYLCQPRNLQNYRNPYQLLSAKRGESTPAERYYIFHGYVSPFHFERCSHILKYFIYILYLLNFVCAICILRRESVGMITVMNFKYNSVVNNDSIKTSLLFIMYVCML